MEDLASLRRVKLEQCVGLATYKSDASQVRLATSLISESRCFRERGSCQSHTCYDTAQILLN